MENDEEIRRKKISIARLGKKHSAETKVKMSLASLGKPKSEEHRKKMSLAMLGKRLRLGVKHSIETRIKMSLARKGKTRRPMSEETKIKISKANKGKPGLIYTPELRRKIGNAHRGKKSYLWKGGISPMNKMIRMSLDMKLWREAVFERDDYTCQECGTRGCELQADHIKPFVLFPELRTAIDNGQTLCVACHKMKTKKDFPIIRSMQSLIKI